MDVHDVLVRKNGKLMWTCKHLIWYSITQQLIWYSITQQLAWYSITQQLAWYSITQQLTWYSITQQLTWYSITQQLTWYSITQQLAWYSITQQLTWHSITQQLAWYSITQSWLGILLRSSWLWRIRVNENSHYCTPVIYPHTHLELFIGWERVPKLLILLSKIWLVRNSSVFEKKNSFYCCIYRQNYFCLCKSRILPWQTCEFWQIQHHIIWQKSIL